MHLRDDLGMDSMSMLTLILNLEHHVQGFRANPIDLEDQDFESIQSIVQYVQRHIGHAVHTLTEQHATT